MLESNNIHKAMIKASDCPQVPLLSATAATRLDPNVKAIAEEICKKNSASLSGFLRQCVHLLVEEYTGKEVR